MLQFVGYVIVLVLELPVLCEQINKTPWLPEASDKDVENEKLLVVLVPEL